MFLDAKLLDIEATVERATAAIARTGAEFLTVHAVDRKTLDAAVRGRGGSKLKLLGVTVLTNLGPADLIQQGTDIPPGELVLHRAMLAKEAGFDGVVASGLEAASIREASGTGFLIVTPGIRPKGSATQDQTRIVTPGDAISAGADYLVVGRPITAAPDPRASGRGDRRRDRVSAFRLARQRAQRSGAIKPPHRQRPRPASTATCRHGRR